MKVQIVRKTTNELPKYETPGSAGMDVRADLWEIKEDFLFGAEVLRPNDTISGIVIHPGGRALIPTGIYTAFNTDYECQVRPRSGLALKYGIFVLNSPGTIDGDYRNEHGVILANFGTQDFIVRQGDRIGQLVFHKIERIEWEEVEELDTTDRSGGFGSTNIK